MIVEDNFSMMREKVDIIGGMWFSFIQNNNYPKMWFFSFKIKLPPKKHLFENLNCRTDILKYLFTFLGIYYKFSYIRRLSESLRFLLPEFLIVSIVQQMALSEQRI